MAYAFISYMENTTVRINNLRELLSEEAAFGGHHGSITRLAQRVNTNPAYISQILSETNPAKVGDGLARRLENAYEKERGWMDQEDHEAINMEVLLDVYEAIERILSATEYDLSPELKRVLLEDVYRIYESTKTVDPATVKTLYNRLKRSA